jgi:hypothetical protein
MTITYRGAGAGEDANNAAVSPNLVETATAGDLLLVYTMFRSSAGTASVSGSMTEAYSGVGGSRHDYLWYKIAAGGETDFTVTPSGGSANDTLVAQAATFRGTKLSGVLDNVAADSIWTTSQNCGPITACVPTGADGLVVVVAGKQDDWTSVDTLTGDSLTWAEIGEPDSTLGTDAGMVWNYAIWVGAAPSLTNKTFTVTGGTAVNGGGCMVSFFAEPAAAGGQPTVKRFGGVPSMAINRGVW